MMAADIESPQTLHEPIAVFQEIEKRVKAITPEQYRRSTTVFSRGMRLLGPATDRMKQLYTLNILLLEETADLDASLRRTGTRGHEMTFNRLNLVNMYQRIVAVVLGIEVAKIHGFGIAFDIDCDWNVVAACG